MLCFVPVLRGVCLVCLQLCKEEGSSLVSLQLLRGGIWALSMSLLGFVMGTMLANYYMCGIMLVFRTVFNMLVRNVSPRRPMCCMCLMFSFQDLVSSELLFLFCFIAYWTWGFVSVMLYPCILCVALLMDLFVLWVACL